MKSQLPVSKAKTAYGLLSEIAALAIEEPKRMAMGRWRVTQAMVDMGMESTPSRGLPKCGTVGCIGGWVNTLSPTNEDAGSVLGLDCVQEDELFYDNLCEAPQQQTLAHARKVGAHIRRFQKKYKAQLLANKVR